MPSISLIVLVYLFQLPFSISQNNIQINIPSAVSETDYIWRTLQDIPFFEKNNYQVSLPKAPLIKSLIGKARAKQLVNTDYEALKILMEDSVYRAADYEAGYQKILSDRKLINKMIKELRKSAFNWPFKLFDTYQINLTLYGPGGSFNPEEGSILIFTTPNGLFKQYDHPAPTIIHEIVHIGIEHSIIQQFKVPHSLKERIVDQMVHTFFQKKLPDYNIQDMGDYRIDNFISGKEDFKDLDNIVRKILN